MPEVLPADLVRFEETAWLLASGRRPVCAYVYDLAHLRLHAQHTRNSLPAHTRLLYAVKANAEAAVLATLAPVVDGFEVASAGEVEKVRAVTPTAGIAFGGPGKTEAELACALERGVEVIHVESLNELLRLEGVAQRASRAVDVLLRVNLADRLPGATLTMGGPTQFGIDEAQLAEVVDRAQRCRWVSLRGFHLHLVSNQLDASAHARLVGRYVERALAWANDYGVALSMVNAGGGFGVGYGEPVRLFDVALFAARLDEELSRHPGSAELTLVFECGRFLIASAGAYLAEVLDIKVNHGRHFAVVRGGTHHFRLPASWGHSHPFRVVPTGDTGARAPEISDCPVTVVGQLCSPKDVLARDVPVGRLRIGDVLVFHHAGAYGWSISHHDFLSHPHPDVVLLDELHPAVTSTELAKRRRRLVGRAMGTDQQSDENLRPYDEVDGPHTNHSPVAKAALRARIELRPEASALRPRRQKPPRPAQGDAMGALEAIHARRSLGELVEPAPQGADLEALLAAAAAAPDHGRLRPWRFYPLAGEAKDAFGQLLADAYARRCESQGVEPDATRLTKERRKLGRAPLVIVAACVPLGGPTPEIEQLLATGAAVQNLLVAATALGYGSMWRTGPAAYDDEVKAALGLAPSDSIVGFIYLGTSPGRARR